MTALITATVGSAILGAGASAYSANKASKSANKDRAAAQDAEAARLAFEQERYDEWREVYGPMQSNLASYYSELTPEKYAAASVEEFDKQFETSMTRINESLAQRGIVDSGVAASIEAQSELGAAETRAGLRRDAEDIVQNQKTNFLQIGLGQNPANSVGSAMGNATQNAWNQSARSQQQANMEGAAAGQAIGGAINSIGDAIYANRNYQPATQPNATRTGTVVPPGMRDPRLTPAPKQWDY